VQVVLRAAKRLRAVAHEHRTSKPALAAALMTSNHLDTLLVELDRCLDRDGTLSDDASSALRELRQRINMVLCSL